MTDDRPLADPDADWWTMEDIAAHWDIKLKTVHGYRWRGLGQLPPEDTIIGRTPVWRPATIIGFKRPGRGARTDLKDGGS